MRLLPRLALLLLLAATASAQRLVAGPETLLGDPAVGPWSGAIAAPALASDGDETLAVFPSPRRDGGFAIHAVRLDRFGKPVGMQRTLVAASSPIRVTAQQLLAIWLDGVYVVFYQQEFAFRALRVSREGDLLDDRLIHDRFLRAWPAEVALVAGAEELVFTTYRTVLRLRRDLTTIALVEGAGGGYSLEHPIAAGEDGYAIVHPVEPAGTIQLLQNGVPGLMVRVGPMGVPRVPGIAWNGSEYVVAWANCNGIRNSGCPLMLSRFDASLRPVAQPVEIGQEVCCGRVRAVHAGGGIVAVTWPGERRWLLQRFRGAAAVDAQPVALPIAAHAVSLNAHGMLVIGDERGQVIAVPVTGAPVPWTITVHAALQSAAAEELLAAGASSTHFAVAFGRGERVHSRLYHRTGSLVREADHAGGRGATAAIGTDGKDLVLVTYDGGVTFENLTSPGFGRYVTGLSGFANVAWNGRAYVVGTGSRTVQFQPNGLLLPLCRTSPGPGVVAAGDGEVVHVRHGSLRITRLDGDCAAGPALVTPLPSIVASRPALAFRGGTLGAFFSDREGRAHFAIAPPGKPFVLSDDAFGGRVSRDLALVPVDGGWLGLYASFGVAKAVLFDEFGSVKGTIVVAETGDTAVALAPLDATRVLAFYSRPVEEAPFHGVSRVFVRPITLEPFAPRRRSAGH